MQNKWLWGVLSGLLVGVTGCPDVTVDEGEVGSGGPIVEFDPSNRIVPFPNNLLLDPTTGKVNLPASCGESPASAATRTMVLNQLDGFGTYQVAMSVTFSAPVDAASLVDNVVLYQRIAGMTPVTTGMPVPVITIPGMSVRSVPDPADPTVCASTAMVDSLTIVPLVPLEQKSFYSVGVLAGITTAGGEPFTPSFTWALVRQAENPVTLVDPACNSGTGMCEIASDRTPLDPTTPAGLASLNGIHRLWTAHAGAVEFLVGKGHAREDLLLAWEFKTQTVTDPLDPAVATSPAAMVNTLPLTGPVDAAPVPVSIAAAAANRAAYPYLVCTTGSVTPPVPAEPNNTQCYLKLALGGGLGCTSAATCEPAYALGSGTCAALGCAAVGDVLAGRLRSKQYQTARPNAAVPARTIPGPWNDPIAPTVVGEELLSVLITIPATAAPATGYPTTIYQHGLGSSRTTLFAIAPQLAASGSATVAIDAVAHDSRAVQNSVEAARGCAGTPAFATAPQCFAGFLSPDLAATRDNIRQTVLDQLGLVAALEACGTTMCGALDVDPAHIAYAGLSLVGGTIGSITTAVSDTLTASVLNVPGAGWADIFENTETLAIRCTLVDGLIDAGVLMGDKWNPTVMPNTGLCTTEAWKAQPGYRQFSAIARWVLDAADPANFTRKLAARTFLIQEVVGDQVVPNLATDREGALVGLTAMDAACGVPNANPPPAMLPSPAITTMPTTSKFVKYATIAPGTATCPPGNTFTHGSLLRPAPTPGGMTVGNDGQLGTARLQTDALTFLLLNR